VLDVVIPGVDAETTRKLVESAHRICPYSRATSGNIEVELRAREG
jgi:organic hydroperoxide reductase OsmC/OhrA